VDTRLFEILRRRPRRLRQRDLSEVAKAIVAVVRKQARAQTGTYKNLSYIWLTGLDTDVMVLKEDWELIFPFIEDGSLNPVLAPAQPQTGFLHPTTHYDGSVVDINDTQFYHRVLNILKGLFTEEFPTSDL
jgi:hypothetical protein